MIWIKVTAWSIAAYFKEHRWGSIPSFTLYPLGEERSMIKRHFPGWPDLGTRPRGLMWIVSFGLASDNLPASNSILICSVITLGWPFADGWFFLADLRTDKGMAILDNSRQGAVKADWESLSKAFTDKLCKLLIWVATKVTLEQQLEFRAIYKIFYNYFVYNLPAAILTLYNVFRC